MKGVDRKGEAMRFLTMMAVFLSIYATIATFVLSNAA